MDTLPNVRKGNWERMLWAGLLGLLLCLTVQVDQATGQRGRRTGRPASRGRSVGDDAAQAADMVTQMARDILTNNLMAQKPLTTADMEAIEKALKRAARYQQRFPADQKGYLFLIRGLLAYYRADWKRAREFIVHAAQAAPQNGDISDTAIVLGLLQGDYDLARSALAARNAGQAVRQEEPAPAASVLPGGATTQPAQQPSDANQPAPGTGMARGKQPRHRRLSEPNATAANTGQATVPAEKKPERPKSRFERYVPSKSKEQPGRKTGRAGRAGRPGMPGMPGMPRPPGMPPGARRRPGQGGPPMYQPGMGLGPAAPVLDQRMIPGMGVNRGRGRGRGAGRGRGTRQAAPAEKEFSESVLDLPVAAMPFEHLGELLGTVQLRALNGGVFRYQPGQGQLLWVLLWTLPEDGNPIAAATGTQRSSSRGRSPKARKSPARRGRATRPRGAPGMMPGPPGMPGMPGAPGMMGPVPSGSGRQQRGWTHRGGRNAAAPGLAETFETLREMFRQVVSNGIGSVVAVNLDPINRKGQLIEEMMSHVWPWETCMAADPVNRANWPLTERVSPVLVLVGVDGRIRYMGPADCFLVEMLVQQELPRVVAAQTQMPALQAGPGMAPGLPGHQPGGLKLPRLLFGSRPQAPAKGGPGQPSPRATKGTTTAASPGVRPPTPKKSNLQAANMLQAAYANRRLLPRKACSICDEIIQRWPDSLEADEARIFIEDVLRTNRRLREERASQGKYTGP